ncbi:hypothetical protein AC249_AIPGENE8758 [Exaiptasia diaphana]|nr:hypothetical protein AC249_AIPGENE8758 [Exaiptasia diaphana]
MSAKKAEKLTCKKPTKSPIKISSSTSPSKPEKRPASTQISESAENTHRLKVAMVENMTIGYVHELSKLRINRGNTMDYCSCQLQTATKNVDALLYSPHKRPLLHESQERRSPVKLTSFTFTPAKDKIIVNDMNAITTPQQDEYSFQYQTPTEVQTPVFQVLDVLSTSKEWDVVTVNGKLFGLKDQRMVGSPRKRLLEAVLDDGSVTWLTRPMIRHES